MEFRYLQSFGRERYRIYEDGTILRETRIGARGNICRGSELKQHINSNGYRRVVLSRKKNEYKRYFVHRLVAEVFCQKKEGCNVVNHKDGNKSNNHYSNLEWVTSSYNNHHAYTTGLKKPTDFSGEKHPMHKLSEEQVKEIRKTYIKGDLRFGQCALARAYGVTQAMIYAIVTQRNWKNITGEADEDRTANV